jgi:uncharacterized protein YprB with RNaseH-like and TPR domain
MSLRDRLRSMQGVAGQPPPPDLAPPGSPGPYAPGADVAGVGLEPAGAPVTLRVQPAASRAPSAHGPEELLPGSARETPYGCCFVAEWRFPHAHLHGASPLAIALECSPGAGAPLLVRTPAERAVLARMDPRRVIYLDTETTGLAGGTGTYAFLVGVARFDGDDFVVRQLFMRELAEEAAVLHLLAGELDGCDVLVTYNGKAFDWPLLETRFALGRRLGPRRPVDPGAHVDLLFAARRLWRARLESCSLAQVERDVLGVRRGDDTPGWLIPQLYFAYLRTRDARPLAGVFRHNTLDLLSLAGLLGHVAGIARDAERATAADELLALGRCFEDAGDLARALACYEAALAGAGPLSASMRHTAQREARLRAATLLKRLRRHADAAAHWEALVASAVHGSQPPDIRPYEELAKHYEHVARHHAAARVYVERALALLEGDWARRAQRDRARLLHRLRRLDRLLAVRPRP